MVGPLARSFSRRGICDWASAPVPVFLIFLVVSFVIEQALAPSFGIKGVGLPFVLSLAPYLSIVALLNGPKEELLYRGLFLQRYDAFVPKRSTNLLSTIVFALSVVEPEYFAQLVGAVLVALVGGLLFVRLMRETTALSDPASAKVPLQSLSILL